MSIRSKTAQPNSRAPLLTLDEIAEHLKVHTSQVLRHVSAGMPAMDLSAVHTPGKRAKRLLRFDAGEVEAWLAQRRAPAGGSR
jgi:predicted DNA-binding transcriptional regulator AlpA